ncbi:MAG: rRNA pseudouridine synthase [Clostridia bacterium]|nr:rRNA pseudouridine synthase [Clostridia bacterium]
MQERLQKLLSGFGVASRREAERLIEAGVVKVNGKVATLGMRADPETDRIEVDGRRIEKRPPLTYVMLNKPRGYVTTTDDERGRRTVTDLLEGLSHRVYPVGRLDMNTEGLLLLTNDGAFAQRLTHPKFEVEKEYRANVTGDAEAAVKLFRKGMLIDGETFSPARARVLKTDPTTGVSTISVIIHEGKNRQVRRMCETAGLEVRRLKRVAEGPLTLTGLAPGKWRLLTEEEVSLLMGKKIRGKIQ